MARLEQLISGIQLGDGKPSHMLSQLQRTGVTTDQKLIKYFWLQRLPVDTRGVLAVFSKSDPEMTVEQLAAIADEVMDVTRLSTIERSVNKSVNALGSVQASTLDNASNIENRVTNIEKALKRIESKLGNDSRKRSRSSTPKGKRKNESSEDICWYHKRYAEKATKCVSPCTFNPKN